MSNFAINNGTLTSKEGTLKLEEVDYIVPRKGLLLQQYVFMGTRAGRYVKLRVSDQQVEQILAELKAANAPVMKNFDMLMEFNGATGSLKSGKSKRINNNNAWLTSNVVVYVPKRKILASDDNPVCINVKDVVFSTTSRNTRFGILPGDYCTYFGSASDQAFLSHPKKEHSQQLNQHLIDNGSVIGTQASKTYKDCFWLGKLLSPLSFRKHEEIGLTDDAIIYKFKKGSKVETVFLPFNEIAYIDMERGLFHSNRIVICGQQNIITHLQFSNKAIKELKKILIDRAIPVADKVVRPRMCLGLLPNPFAKRTLAVTADKLVYSDTKLKYGITLPTDKVEAIVWKKKFFLFFVGYLFIDGEIANIRRDQDSDSQSITMPKIWFTKKNLIKSLAKHARYNKREDKKLHKIDDVSYS